MAKTGAITKKNATDQDVPVGGPAVVMSLKMEAELHDRLRKLAFDRRESMRAFILRGIEEVLKAEKY